MFKAILPSKRVPSSDFTMLTALAESAANGKENLPDPQAALAVSVNPNVKPPMTTNKSSGRVTEKKKKALAKMKEEPLELALTNQDFNQLLDDLQIPSYLRARLLGMDSTVKAAMLKSSQTLALCPPPPTSPISPSVNPTPKLRRTRSTELIVSPSLSKPSFDLDFPFPPQFDESSSGSKTPSASGSETSHFASSHARGASLDISGMFSRSQAHLPLSGEPVQIKAFKEKAVPKNLSPIKFVSILTGTSSTLLDVENVKKLRLLLRNESASWSEEFLRQGGYAALLTRLNEILEVEWREEQHDDQVLHELLRCFRALSTSSIGCFALRSSCPTPFTQLISLLYSDKKPGEVATRQLIVDLLINLFELYPGSSLPSSGSNYNPSGRSRHREIWDSELKLPPVSNLITLPAPHKTLYSLIRTLLLTPAPAPAEAPPAPVSPHEFIESLHRPRIYKTYLQELSDVCRDYFWVFCHPNNTIWVLAETDEGKVEKPKAPGGMTGGVEFEAMGYFTTHLKLLNALSNAAAELNLPKDHEHSAHQLHSDLFASGLERIILISRKASTTYYPTLHLELARYISFAGKAGYELPWTVSRLIGMPPSALSKNGVSPSQRTPNGSSPARRPKTPLLPSPRKIEPLRFD